MFHRSASRMRYFGKRLGNRLTQAAQLRALAKVAETWAEDNDIREARDGLLCLAANLAAVADDLDGRLNEAWHESETAAKQRRSAG